MEILISKQDCFIFFFFTGLVNINFGTHTCVHMGTELKSSESAYAPTAISYPIEEEFAKLHTVLMVDLDHESTKGMKDYLSITA